MIKQAPTRLTAGFDIGPGYHLDPEAKFVPAKPKAALVDALRFGVPVLKGCAWSFVPKSIKDQMMTLAALDPASIELEALIRRVPDNTVLTCAWVESKSGPNPDVQGWIIANFWPNVGGSEGVVLKFMHPDHNSNRLSQALVAQLLTGLDTEGRPELVSSSTALYTSKRDKSLYQQLVEHGFETVNTILP